jgi:beta-lactam-binding protein with PASTA domain
MDTTLSPLAGQLLDGRYRVESWVARGGMASVYLGTDTRLDRPVALKIAHAELAGDAGFVRRFISEARSAASLSSPHVVAVYDQGSDGEIHYLAMEYVPGPTLRALLTERGRLSPREALDIIEGVLSGLAVAHDSGIVHRDVKPENVLLTNGNAVKVADFGLARAMTGADHTKTGMIIGTAAYLAPEQVSGGKSDPRTDVYAAGVMLFELLTGTQPHTGDTPLAVAYKHVNEIVPAPSSIVNGLPPALDALVGLATSRDPDLRPADAGHFLLAVTEVRQGMPITGLRSRGQHAAPAGPGAARVANGYSAADSRGSHAAYPPAGTGQDGSSGQFGSSGQDGSSGQFGSSGQVGSGPVGSSGQAGSSGQVGTGPVGFSGQVGTGPVGSGPVSGELAGTGNPNDGPSGRSAGANPLASWPQFPGPASGQHSWPTASHPGAGSPPHGASVPGSSALPSRDGYDGPGELLPAAVIRPDAYRGTNHTMIVPASGLADIYRDEAGGYHDKAPSGYRRRTEPWLQRWLFSRRLGYLAALLVVLASVAVAIWWFSSGQYTTIPQVGNLAAVTARTELVNEGFTVRIGTGQHSSLPRGEVIRTEPANGARARHGSPVTIIESLGPVQIAVPPVTGLPLAGAEVTLKRSGLTPGSVSNVPSTTVPVGIVTATNPVAGTRWPKTRPVAITVSAGQPLPSFVGGQVSAAQGAAQAGGYTINPIQDATGKAPVDTIVRQSPAAGSVISPHEIVTVYFSPGPPMVAVPNVEGMPAHQAINELESAGFTVTVNKVGPGNMVTSYSPTGPAPAGSAITINVGFQF